MEVLYLVFYPIDINLINVQKSINKSDYLPEYQCSIAIVKILCANRSP